MWKHHPPSPFYFEGDWFRNGFHYFPRPLFCCKHDLSMVGLRLQDTALHASCVSCDVWSSYDQCDVFIDLSYLLGIFSSVSSKLFQCSYTDQSYYSLLQIEAVRCFVANAMVECTDFVLSLFETPFLILCGLRKIS